MTSANEFLMSGGSKSATFPEVGTTWTGVICATPEVRQQTDLTTGEPKFWPDGKPRQQLVVTIQTDARDTDDPDDDGQRAFYIKGNMQKAVREAVRKAGVKGIEVGGTLTVTYSADGARTKNGFNPPKLYTAVYQPPTAAAANAFLNGGEQTSASDAPADPWGQPQGPAPSFAQPPQAAATPQATQGNGQPNPPVTAEALAAIAQLTPEQKAALGIPV